MFSQPGGVNKQKSSYRNTRCRNIGFARDERLSEDLFPAVNVAHFLFFVFYSAITTEGG